MAVCEDLLASTSLIPTDWSGLEGWRGPPGPKFCLEQNSFFQLVCIDLTLKLSSSVAKNTQQHTWDEWHGFVMEEVG